MTQKIIFDIQGIYTIKDISDIIGNYSVEAGKIVVSEEQLAVLLLAYKGTQFWYKNGQLHRDNDLPAIIYPSGIQYWCQNGKFHRDGDLPAMIDSKGNRAWYKEGKLHRDPNLKPRHHPVHLQTTG